MRSEKFGLSSLEGSMKLGEFPTRQPAWGTAVEEAGDGDGEAGPPGKGESGSGDASPSHKLAKISG